MKRGIRIEGNLAYVPLTRGYEAVIDAADVSLVEGWNWCALVRPKSVYAMRFSEGAEKKTILLHRVIAGTPEGMDTDHIDGNGLNNRRSNVRVATKGQNMHNQRLSSANTSGVKGVSWVKRRQKWQAQICANGKRVGLGYYDTIADAGQAYADASAKMHGEFGRLA